MILVQSLFPHVTLPAGLCRVCLMHPHFCCVTTRLIGFDYFFLAYVFLGNLSRPPWCSGCVVGIWSLLVMVLLFLHYAYKVGRWDQFSLNKDLPFGSSCQSPACGKGGECKNLPVTETIRTLSSVITPGRLIRYFSLFQYLLLVLLLSLDCSTLPLICTL